jgi:hypothetical protein
MHLDAFSTFILNWSLDACPCNIQGLDLQAFSLSPTLLSHVLSHHMTPNLSRAAGRDRGVINFDDMKVPMEFSCA